MPEIRIKNEVALWGPVSIACQTIKLKANESKKMVRGGPSSFNFILSGDADYLILFGGDGYDRHATIG